jgi:hypothetical protein
MRRRPSRIVPAVVAVDPTRRLKSPEASRLRHARVYLANGVSGVIG